MYKILKTFINKAIKIPNIAVKETQRTILYENKDLSVVFFKWKKGDGLPEHDHYGKCIFQVLDGSLLETRCCGKQTILKTNDFGTIDKGIKHSIEPLENSKSIHVYSPPPPKK